MTAALLFALAADSIALLDTPDRPSPATWALLAAAIVLGLAIAIPAVADVARDYRRRHLTGRDPRRWETW